MVDVRRILRITSELSSNQIISNGELQSGGECPGLSCLECTVSATRWSHSVERNDRIVSKEDDQSLVQAIPHNIYMALLRQGKTSPIDRKKDFFISAFHSDVLTI